MVTIYSLAFQHANFSYKVQHSTIVDNGIFVLQEKTDKTFMTVCQFQLYCVNLALK